MCTYAVTVERVNKLRMELQSFLGEKDTLAEDVRMKERALANYERRCAAMSPEDDTLPHMIMLMEKCRNRLLETMLALEATKAKINLYTRMIEQDAQYISTHRDAFQQACTSKTMLPFNHQEVLENIF